nr:Uncharacterised protein [Raoultella sp. NCTC 9187]
MEEAANLYYWEQERLLIRLSGIMNMDCSWFP